MPDVAALCRRVLLIDQGQLRYDGDLDRLPAALAPDQLVRVTPTDGQDGQDWSHFGEVAEDDGDGTGAGASVVLRVPRADTTWPSPPFSC
jgi:ABC-2 type transport system ATP-binding protein